jgi:large subunit ribosomal protein LP0
MIRVSLRGKGVVLMGKNTMVRRAVRGFLGEFPQFEKVLPFIKGNIGFVFTSGDLKDIREIIVSNKVAAPARAGAVAPNDVFVPAGNTGMEPGKTSFFQALGIPTKIARGTIEIVNDVQVVSAGNKVGTSEATLLNMLNISPFTYGMTVVQVYDNGAVFPSAILDIEESTLLSQFTSGISTIAAISLAIGIPTVPSVVHSLVNSYKNLLAVSLATDYEFEGSKKVSPACDHNAACPQPSSLHCTGCKNSFSTGDFLCPVQLRAGRRRLVIHTLILRLHFLSTSRSSHRRDDVPLTPHSAQGVPRQPRGLRRRRCSRRVRVCARRRRRGRPGRQGGGEGGVRGRRHGLRPLRLSARRSAISNPRSAITRACRVVETLRRAVGGTLVYVHASHRVAHGVSLRVGQRETITRFFLTDTDDLGNTDESDDAG